MPYTSFGVVGLLAFRESTHEDAMSARSTVGAYWEVQATDDPTISVVLTHL